MSLVSPQERSHSFVVLSTFKDKVVCSSLQIADNFGKKHKHVVRDIEELIQKRSEMGPNLGPLEKDSLVRGEMNSNLDPSPIEGYFMETTYVDSKNRRKKMYYMTEEGALILIGSYRTPMTVRWIGKYVKSFKATRDYMLDMTEKKMLQLDAAFKEQQLLAAAKQDEAEMLTEEIKKKQEELKELKSRRNGKGGVRVYVCVQQPTGASTYFRYFEAGTLSPTAQLIAQQMTVAYNGRMQTRRAEEILRHLLPSLSDTQRRYVVVDGDDVVDGWADDLSVAETLEGLAYLSPVQFEDMDSAKMYVEKEILNNLV